MLIFIYFLKHFFWPQEGTAMIILCEFGEKSLLSFNGGKWSLLKFSQTSRLPCEPVPWWTLGTRPTSTPCAAQIWGGSQMASPPAQSHSWGTQPEGRCCKHKNKGKQASVSQVSRSLTEQRGARPAVSCTFLLRGASITHFPGVL